MTYQTTKPEAAYQPLRSIPLVRPMSCLSPAFVACQDPHAVARQMATRTPDLAPDRSDPRHPWHDALARARADLAATGRRAAGPRCGCGGP